MRNLAGSLFLTIVLFNSAWAGNLKIVGVDVAWSSLSEPSPTFYVMIFNEQGVTARLTSWQLRLGLTSVGETTGVFQFASADISRDDTYLLFGDSWVLNGFPEPPPSPLIEGPAGSVTLGDLSLSGYGREVPFSGKSLIKADFCASEDTRGTFAVTAVPGESFWTSSDAPGFTPIGFDNVPLDAVEPFIIGIVYIPEPHGILLLSILANACVFICRARGNQGNL